MSCVDESNLFEVLSSGIGRMEQSLFDIKATLQQHIRLLNNHSANLERIELRQRAETKTLDNHEDRIKALECRR